MGEVGKRVEGGGAQHRHLGCPLKPPMRFPQWEAPSGVWGVRINRHTTPDSPTHRQPAAVKGPTGPHSATWAWAPLLSQAQPHATACMGEGLINGRGAATGKGPRSPTLTDALELRAQREGERTAPWGPAGGGAQGVRPRTCKSQRAASQQAPALDMQAHQSPCPQPAGSRTIEHSS